MHELSFSFQYGRSPHTSWGIPTSPYFNSYPCVKGNLATAVILLPPRLFQFTPLHEGRYAGRPCRPRFLPDFNSRPCVRGDSKIRQIITSVLLQNYQISNILSQVQLEWVKKLLFPGHVLLFFCAYLPLFSVLAW